MQMASRLCGAAVLIGMAACGTPRMVVPPEVAKASEEVAATDRSSFSGAMADESFKLGEFAITDVDRKWDSTSKSNELGFTNAATAGGYSFKVTGPEGEMGGGCMTEGEDKSKNLGDGVTFSKTKARLGCTCRGDGDAVKFVIAASTGDKYDGELTTRKGTYKIWGLYKTEGSLSTGDPSGYRIDNENGPCGAVEVLRPGRAWFPKGMDPGERADLACLYAGLMLYMPPNDTFK
jgi:hypothetical protein